ncbi:MAG TPA: GyrI-like domain-containing protein [Cytophagales bacterium]|nr:GyrI-like domain-containing protein [Cytophagales bacterium]
MEQKLEKPKNFFYHEGRTTLKEIGSYSDVKIPRLLENVAKQGIKVNGPMEFIYIGATGDENQEFLLQIALPIEEDLSALAPYKIRKSSEFKCLSLELKGSLEALHPTYDKAFAYIQQNRMIPSGEIREVYHVYKDFTSDENITEIQIGIN